LGENTVIIRRDRPDPTIRPIVAVSLGPTAKACLFKPDLWDPETFEAGVRKRFCRRLPNLNRPRLRRFKRFVTRFIRRNFIPLESEVDCSVETWLSKTDYTEVRKLELLEKFREIVNPHDPRYSVVDSFVKDEFYTEPKHARVINSRSDEFKTLVGPIFQLISDAVFKHAAFIKKIPERERPAYVRRYFEQIEGVFATTDFKSFESSFRAQIMASCEMKLYRYMTQLLPAELRMQFYRHLDVISGENHCKSPYVSVYTEARRMSGEMCTSLGNGFTNLCLFSFMCEESGMSQSDYKVVIEGDDGLARVRTIPNVQPCTDLGFTIDLITHDKLSDASFCGMIFDPDDCCILTDPMEVLAKFGWGTNQYAGANIKTHKALLRAKSLSYLHQYPGCPIIQSIAKCYERLTIGVQLDKILRSMRMDLYERHKLQSALDWWNLNKKLPFKPITFRSRDLVARLWHIQPDTQIQVERYFDSITQIGPICPPIDFPPLWIVHYDRFAGDEEVDRTTHKFY